MRCMVALRSRCRGRPMDSRPSTWVPRWSASPDSNRTPFSGFQRPISSNNIPIRDRRQPGTREIANDANEHDSGNADVTVSIFRTEESTRKWERVTNDLLAIPDGSWAQSHTRRSQQCLQYMSLHQLSKPDLVVNLWTRITKEVPQRQIPPAMLDYAVLALASHGYPQLAVTVLDEFIERFGNFDAERHFPQTFHLNGVMHAYAQKEMPNETEELFRKFVSPRSAITPDEINVVTALDAWSRVGDGARAQALLDWLILEHEEIQLNVACYNVVLTAWARSKSPDAAQKAEALIQRMPFAPTAGCWISVIAAWASSEKQPEGTHRAEQLLWHAYDQNQAIDGFCVNAVLHAWGKLGKSEHCLNLLRGWIHRVSNDDTVPREMLPDVSSFNTVLHAIATSRPPDAGDQAKTLLAEMQQLGLTPDRITFNSVLDAMAKTGAVTDAQGLLDQMEKGEENKRQTRESMEQRKIAYNTVILAWAHRCQQQSNRGHAGMECARNAQQVLTLMKERGVEPDSVSYNTVLKTLAHAGGSAGAEMAESILKSIESNGLATEVSYSIVIDAWAKSGDRMGPQRAYDILRRMDQPQSAVRPNVVVYSSVIHSFAKNPDSRSIETVERIVTDMEQDSTKPFPDLITYCSVLAIYANCRHPKKAARAWDVLVRMKLHFQQGKMTKHRGNPREIFLKAHKLVLIACAYTGREVHRQVRDEALDIAMRTFESMPSRKNDDVYVAFFKAIFNLVYDIDERHKRIREAFLEYCANESHVNDMILQRLEMVTTEDFFRQLLHESKTSGSGASGDYNRS